MVSLNILFPSSSQDLTETVTALKQLRDEVSQHQSLGDSQSNAEILLHEHLKREAAAKVSQSVNTHRHVMMDFLVNCQPHRFAKMF